MDGDSQAKAYVVDDDPAVCEAIKETLEREGVVATCFQTAESCRDALRTEDCDLLLTEILLPSMNGIDLLHEVRIMRPWIPVFLMTGYADVSTAVNVMKAGAAGFLEKPLDSGDLLRAAKVAVRHRAQLRIGRTAALTEMEMRITELVVQGRSNREIAEKLKRSIRTVEVHRGHAMHKLGATSQADFFRKAVLMGMIRE